MWTMEDSISMGSEGIDNDFNDLDDDIMEIGKRKSKDKINHSKNLPSVGSKKSFICLIVGDLHAGSIPSILSLSNAEFTWDAEVIEANYGCLIDKSDRVELKIVGLTIDKKLPSYEEASKLYLNYLKIANIVIFVFSLISPLSLQRATRLKQIMDQETEKSEQMPISFLVGTGLELRNALETELFNKVIYEKLYGLYLKRKLLEIDDIVELKKGSKRVVKSNKIQEVSSQIGTLDFYESSFLPGEMKATLDDICLHAWKCSPSQKKGSKIYGVKWKKKNVLKVMKHTKSKSIMIEDDLNKIYTSEKRFREKIEKIIPSSFEEKKDKLEIEFSLNRKKSYETHNILVDKNYKEDEIELIGSPQPESGSIVTHKPKDKKLLIAPSKVVSNNLNVVSNNNTMNNTITNTNTTKKIGPKNNSTSSISPQTVVNIPKPTTPFEGIQTYFFPNGDQYSGNWKNGTFHGMGTLKLANGTIYIGGFCNGKFENEGYFASPDGCFYKGNWSDSKRNGKGEQRYLDGSRYTGEWKEDRKHGRGIIDFPDGTSFFVQFNNDVLENKVPTIVNNEPMIVEVKKKDEIFNVNNNVNNNVNGGVNGVNVGVNPSPPQPVQDLQQQPPPQQQGLQVQQPPQGELVVPVNDKEPVQEKKDDIKQEDNDIMKLYPSFKQLDRNHLTMSEKKLGEGYYGIVYHGFYMGSQVAIKKLKQNIPENVLGKFIQEIHILSNIDHPNIVKYVGAIVEPDLYCIVTEFMNSGNLWDYIHNKSFQFNELIILKVSMDITSAMEYLHHLKPMIIHRDLKSPNILCNKLDTQSLFSCKVADFGLSRFYENSMQEQQMTKGIGTAAWSAPEVVRWQEYTEKADIYSFAIILWELWMRDVPYNGLTRDQVILKVAMENTRPNIPNNKMPDHWKKLIESCWATEPLQRPDFTMIRKKLGNFLDDFFIKQNNQKVSPSNVQPYNPLQPLPNNPILFNPPNLNFQPFLNQPRGVENNNNNTINNNINLNNNNNNVNTPFQMAPNPLFQTPAPQPYVNLNIQQNNNTLNNNNLLNNNNNNNNGVVNPLNNPLNNNNLNLPLLNINTPGNILLNTNLNNNTNTLNNNNTLNNTLNNNTLNNNTLNNNPLISPRKSHNTNNVNNNNDNFKTPLGNSLNIGNLKITFNNQNVPFNPHNPHPTHKPGNSVSNFTFANNNNLNNPTSTNDPSPNRNLAPNRLGHTRHSSLTQNFMAPSQNNSILYSPQMPSNPRNPFVIDNFHDNNNSTEVKKNIFF